MSDNGNDQSADHQKPDQDFGVLGNLPRTRPSVRSPRRSERAETPAPEEAATGAATPPPSSHPAQPAQAPHESSSTAELEALARTGIAIAGGAASLGLRLAGRAAAALRGAVDRT
jgi:hypothetical protein